MREITSIIYLLSLFISINGLITRIFRGTDAPEGKYKHHAHLIASRGTGYFCGGSIIHKRWILTAAHCFPKEDVRHIDVHVGGILRSGYDATTYRVQKIINHESFLVKPFINDIALVRVDRNIEFNEKVKPIALANRSTIMHDNENVVLTGFGRIQDHTLPRKLQTINLKMFGYNKCKETEKRITEKEICTLPSESKGPCSGDSGGALVNKDGIQVGIHSHAYGNGLRTCGEIPEIYTRVSSFQDWIDEKIREYSI